MASSSSGRQNGSKPSRSFLDLALNKSGKVLNSGGGNENKEVENAGCAGDILNNENNNTTNIEAVNLGKSTSSFYGSDTPSALPFRVQKPRRTYEKQSRSPANGRINGGGSSMGSAFSNRSKLTPIYEDAAAGDEDRAVPIFSLANSRQEPTKPKNNPASLLRNPRPSVMKSPIIVPPFMIGFPNAGLTCYLNAVFQALLGLPSFANDLLSLKSEFSDKELDTSKGLVGSFLELVSHKEAGKQDDVNEVVWRFRKKLKEILPQFEGMQDAHEFLVSFSDNLQQETTKLMKSIDINDFINPITENFGYKLQESRTCMRCQHTTEGSKSDFVLRLDMPTSEASTSAAASNGSSRLTMQSMLEKTLQGSGVQIRCEKCCTNKKDLNIHTCEESFSQLPRVLVLYLPRSTPEIDEVTKDVRFRKNRVHVDVFKNLDLTKLVTEKVDKSKVTVDLSNSPSGGAPRVKGRKREPTESNSSYSKNEITPPKTPKLASDPVSLTSETKFKLHVKKNFKNKKSNNSKNKKKRNIQTKDLEEAFLAVNSSSPPKKIPAENIQSPPKMTPNKNGKSINVSSDLSPVDLSKMTEEEKIAYAMKLSLNDSQKIMDEEQEQIDRAIAQSIEAQDEANLSNGLEISERNHFEQQVEKARMRSFSVFKGDAVEGIPIEKGVEALEGAESSSALNLKDDEIKESGDELLKHCQGPETKSEPGGCSYKLTAVVSHLSRLSSVNTGHYVADVYNASKDQWYHYDDLTVTRRDFLEVLRRTVNDGCLFFYTHKDIETWYNN